jgi:hypothetical protein
MLALSGNAFAKKKKDVTPSNHWSFQPVAAEHRYGGVDAFLNEAMANKNLRPLGRAERRTLIRRVYLVMLGLPPSPEEVAQFLNDDSPQAWDRLVDRILASPHYGERMARHWLDLTRFAESNGFETNRERPSAWHFRDYVIKSFNDDKPYDQFVKEHLAGDAMGADIGTGFLVAGPYDIVKSPDPNLTLMQRQDELADMINTTGTAFLGMTIGCARCHDHKFDPITQRDYYSMQAIFAGVKFGEREMKKEVTPNDTKKVAVLRESLTAAERELEKLRGIAATTKKGLSVLRPAVNARLNTEAFEATLAKFVRFTIQRTNSSEPCLDELAVFDKSGKNIALAKAGAIATSSGNLPGYPIHQLAHLNDGKTGNQWSWISNQVGKGWVQIEFAKASSVERIEWSRDRADRFSDRLAIDYTIELSVDGKSWSLAASSNDREPFGGKADPNAFLAKLPAPEAKRASELITEINLNRSRIAAMQNGVKAWVANFSKPGATHRLHRGEPMAKREEVPPDALEVIGSLDLAVDAPEQTRRLALAEWIASEKNPLTARVAVNRLWQFVFGTGIVDTPSDLGTNGTLPTHPELLDWLADDFVKHGWSMKHTLRLLLNSNAFQRSSQPNSAAARIDASSRFFWRFPPRRLEAEAIRDGMLSVAGTLDRKMGGQGFHLFDVDRENVVHYHAKDETGPAEWRRMIYLFKIRQEQDAVFGSFDCPDGNQVIPTRSRSTTPLQALNLFNSRFTMQQAQKLAERLGAHGDRVPQTYELLYNRPATSDEIRDAEKFIEDHNFLGFCRAMLNTSEFLFIF